MIFLRVYETMNPGLNANPKLVQVESIDERRDTVGTILDSMQTLRVGSSLVEVNGIPLGRLEECKDYELHDGDDVTIARVPAKEAVDAWVDLFEWSLSLEPDFWDKTTDIVTGLFKGNIPNGRKVDQDNNTVYNWSGIASTYKAVGLPLPRLYGQIRVGFLVLAQDIFLRETTDGPESVLRILGAVSSGEIDGFDQYSTDQDELTGDAIPTSLEINGTTASSFADVKVWLRTGTNGQEPIPGFDVLRTVYEVNLDVEQGTGTSQDPVVTDWSKARTFSMPVNSEGDRARVSVSFPRGLGNGSSGTLKKKEVTFQIGITKIHPTTGVVQSGRLVYPSATTSFSVKEKLLQNFSRQFEVPFFDPDTYVDPVVSDCIKTDGSNKRWGFIDQTAIDAANTSFSDGSTPEGFTYFGVWKVFTSKAFNPLFGWGTWDGSESAPNVNGFNIFVRQTTGSEGELVLWFGNDSAAGTFQLSGGLVNKDEWFSVGLIYTKSDTLTQQPKVDLYLDGVLIDTAILAEAWAPFTGASGSGPKWFVRPGREATTAAANFAQVYADEQTFYSVAKAGADIGGLHNGAVWSTRENDTNVLFGLKFDQLLGSPQLSPVAYGDVLDNVPVLAHMEIAGSGTVPAIQTGIVNESPGGTTSRGRYKVEVQRTNADAPGIQKYDSLKFKNVITEIDEKVAYAGVALVAVEVPASGQLNGSQPNLTIVARGLKCDVWNGQDESAPAFNKVFTRSPAWQAMDILKNKTDGLGQFFNSVNVRLSEFNAWAEYVEEQVYDMKGKLTITSITFTGAGSAAKAVLRTSSTIPDHWEVGSAVEVGSMPAAWPVTNWKTTISNIATVSPGVTDVSINWPDGGAKNVVPEPSRIGEAAGSWANHGSPTITTENVADIFPASRPHGSQVMDVLSLPNNTGRKITCSDVVTGQQYQLSIDCRVTDGLGDFKIQLNMGDGKATSIVPDDGETHRVTVYVIAGTSVPKSYRVWNTSGATRSIAVACAFAAPIESTELAHDEGVPAGTLTAANLINHPSASEDPAIWVRAGATPLGAELLAVNADPLPDGIPGKAEKWKFNEGGNTLTTTSLSASIPASGTANVYLAMYGKPTGTASNSEVLMQLNANASAGNPFSSWPYGEWTRQGILKASVGASTKMELKATGFGGYGNRQIYIGGMYAALSTTALPYDDGTLGEMFTTEARLPVDMYYGDRGLGAWDAVQMLMSVGRGKPYRIGDEIGVVVSRPRSSEMLFGPWNILSGSFSRTTTSPKEQPNSIAAEIQARDLNYVRDPVQRDHDSLKGGDATSTASYRRVVQDMRGVTERSVAIRELDHSLALMQTQSEVVSFSTTKEGLPCLPGTVFSLTHPTADWGVGAKVYKTSYKDKLFSDVEVTLNSENMLAWSRDLRRSPWETIGATTADEAVITDVTGTIAPPSGLPSDTVVQQIVYPGTSNESQVRQPVANRQGTLFSGSVWIRTNGAAWSSNHLDFVITLSLGGGGSTLNPSLTDTWQRIKLENVDLSGVTTGTDEKTYYKLNQPAADTTARTVYVCAPRMVQKGPDDGLDGIGDQSTGHIKPNYLGWRDSVTLEVHFRPMPLDYLSGTIPVGGVVWVTEHFPSPPAIGDAWMAGPLSELKKFICTTSRLDKEGNRTIQGMQYSEEAFRDPKTYEQIEVQSGPTTQQQQAASIADDAALPAHPEHLEVSEELTFDEDTGRVEKSLLVSWSLDRETESVVDRVIVWGRTDDADGQVGSGRMDVVGQAERNASSVTIPQDALPMTRNVTAEIAVQPVTRNGLRRPVRYCARKKIKAQGYYPDPPQVGGGRVILQGDKALYEVDPPTAGVRGMCVELVRGGVFVNQVVTRLTPGQTVYGPTDDWVQLPTSSDGVGNPRLLARVVTNDNDRGNLVEIPSTLDVTQVPAPVSQASVEDAWAGSGTLDSGLEVATRLSSGIEYLRFTAASSATQLYYTMPQVDLGRSQRWHLSIGIEGRQVHPQVFDTAADDFPALDDRRGLRWTLEGPLDKADPLYDAVEVIPMIRYSTGSSSASEAWREARSGVYDMRTFQIRLRLTRPATFNLEVDRFAYAVRRWARGVANEQVTG